MTDQKGQNDPIDRKLLLDLNSRATVVQDAARGIPEAMLTEYESAQRAIERALRDSGKDIRSAIERAESVSRKAAEAYEAQRNALSFRKPTSEEVIASLIGYQRPQACGVRDFVLPFIRGHADPTFDTESPITTVRQGIVGWGDQSDSPPQIVNTGSGNGQMINGNLDLYWRASIPHSGIFAMQPNQVRPSFPVFGSHKVSGRGWRFSSNDARVGIHA